MTMDVGLPKRGDPVYPQSSMIDHPSALRRAFTLIEMLYVVTVLPFLMVAVSGVYVTFIRDIPRTTRLLQQNTTVLDLLGQIARDMDRATGLPQQLEGQTAGPHTLLIEQRGRVVRYQFEKGRVVRTLGAGPVTAVADEERLWRVPDAVITWRPWVRDGRTYALEVHTHLQERVDGMVRPMLAGARVFFVRGLGPESEAL
jgi:prepilin-type N-terminal cleavage/methylation domain-containing protein